ncbi:hypothetical protein [Paenibacillus crassostreae]|nr:hypothetical protein [Paenibacillus crassostreae]
MTVKSENAKIQGGTFVGDVYVEGNVYFASEEYKSTFDVSNEDVVTGVTEVK